VLDGAIFSLAQKEVELTSFFLSPGGGFFPQRFNSNSLPPPIFLSLFIFTLHFFSSVDFEITLNQLRYPRSILPSALLSLCNPPPSELTFLPPFPPSLLISFPVYRSSLAPPPCQFDLSAGGFVESAKTDLTILARNFFFLFFDPLSFFFLILFF